MSISVLPSGLEGIPMSNHDGGHLLNEFVNGLIKIGLLNGIDSERKVAVVDLLRKLCWRHDCNWGEIIDADLAKLLGTCMYCQGTNKEAINDDGYCPECAEK
jgi:hypothetical protein